MERVNNNRDAPHDAGVCPYCGQIFNYGDYHMCNVKNYQLSSNIDFQSHSLELRIRKEIIGLIEELYNNTRHILTPDQRKVIDEKLLNIEDRLKLLWSES